MAATTLALRLDRDLPTALAVQLSDQVRNAVLSGAVARGDRLPSSRALAADLGISRAVVEHAYDQLLAEGWLLSRRGAGTFVATASVPANAPAPRTPAPPAPDLVRLDTGTPWIDPRHVAGWRRAWREVSAARPPASYGDARGLADLRRALADRLARTRGLVCDPDEVVVTHGTTDGLRHLLAALPDGPIAVEDPGYRAAVRTVQAAGRAVVDLPALRPVTSLAGVRAAYVTPAHQHPLGAVMSGPDRLALLAAARAADAVVVEDDYDSEFRYDVAPVPALAALDRDRVCYLGTASKSVSPSLRLGWMVPPPRLLDVINEHRASAHEGASWPAQRALLSMLRDGYVDRVVRSARRVYAERAPRVAAALAPYGEVEGQPAGMYASVVMDPGATERARACAQDAGFDVPRLADYCRSSTLDGLVVGFGGCTDEQLDAALAALRRGLD
ncbi:MocR-like pyridoxine biosynthesis transcription factor PdxR [Nocardioides pacificus]